MARASIKPERWHFVVKYALFLKKKLRKQGMLIQIHANIAKQDSHVFAAVFRNWSKLQRQAIPRFLIATLTQ